MHNLIDDPAYYIARQELRVALYEQLTSASGQRAVPFTARLAEGMNLRNRQGPTVAPFPDAWKVEPNREDRYYGLLPDNAEKKAYLDADKPYLPWLIDRSEDDGEANE